MAILLSLETSSGICSVALHENEKLLAVLELHQEHAHASKLALLIDQIVCLSDIPMDRISAIGVSSGPGSYTGLRIGTSTAKGMCFALSIPLIAVETLDLMAAQCNSTNLRGWHVCPMIDARRMEVYCSLYDAMGTRLQPVEAVVIDESSFEEHLKTSPTLFFGSGAEKCRSVLHHPNAFFLNDVNPSAAWLGVMAFKKYNRGETEDLLRFEPFYLKEFKAKKAVNLISGLMNKSSG